MTLEHDHDWLLRLLGAAIWFTMAFALSIEICALIGWAFGHAGCGARIGVLLGGVFLLWVLWGDAAARR